MVVLGLCYELGRGVKKDLEGAYLHFHQAARLDYEIGTWFLNELVQEHQDSFRLDMSRATSTASTAVAMLGPPPRNHVSHVYDANANHNGMSGAGPSMHLPSPSPSSALHVPWGTPAPLASMSQSHQFSNHVHVSPCPALRPCPCTPLSCSWLQLYISKYPRACKTLPCPACPALACFRRSLSTDEAGSHSSLVLPCPSTSPDLPPLLVPFRLGEPMSS